jgi:hypothetical protein
MPGETQPWITVAGSIIGVVVGSGIALLGGVIGQWMMLQREREAREHEAERARQGRWNDFQLKTLIDLQDGLEKLVRAAFHVSNVSGQVAIGKESTERAIKCEAAFHAVRNHALKLIVRVEDEDVRARSDDVCTFAEEIKQVGIRFVQNHSYDVSLLNSMHADSRRRFAAVNDRIGKIIRGSAGLGLPASD